MLTRPADDSPSATPAPAVRSTACAADIAAFAEAAQPDTWLRALVPSDVIELIGAKIRRPRLTVLRTTQTWMFDTGSADQQWVELPFSNPAGLFESLVPTANGLVALSVPTFANASTNLDTLLFTFCESTLQWEAERFRTRLPHARQLTVYDNQLFIRVRPNDERFGRITDSAMLLPGRAFPLHLDEVQGNPAIGTRHGICVTGGVSHCAHTHADIYAPAADAWTQLPSMLRRRMFHVSVSGTDGNTLFVIGGADSEERMHDAVERYDFREPTWRYVAPHPVPIITGVACTLGDGQIAVTGGIIPRDYNSTMFIYDVRADVWTPEPAWELPWGATPPSAFTAA